MCVGFRSLIVSGAPVPECVIRAVTALISNAKKNDRIEKSIAYYNDNDIIAFDKALS